METALLFESLERLIRLTDGDKTYLSEILRERKLKKGQFLLQEGAVQRFSCFVLKGLLSSFYIALDGREHIVQFASEGWWITDLNSFTKQVPATYTIQALEDSLVLELPFSHTEAMFMQVPQMERYFRIITERAFIAFQRRIVEFNCMSAKERYLIFRKQHPEFVLRVPQKQIASWLGMTPEFLSKVKKELMVKEE